MLDLVRTRGRNYGTNLGLLILILMVLSLYVVTSTLLWQQRKRQAESLSVGSKALIIKYILQSQTLHILQLLCLQKLSLKRLKATLLISFGDKEKAKTNIISALGAICAFLRMREVWALTVCKIFVTLSMLRCGECLGQNILYRQNS